MLNADIRLMKYLAFFVFAVAIMPVAARQPSSPGIHSHNDYAHADPFNEAFRAGVEAIEADVYLRNGKLLVAHDSTEITASRTLVAMYLEPLRNRLTAGRSLNLLIDFKESYQRLLPQLLRELEPLAALLNDGTNDKPLSIVITGNRPPPALYDRYPKYIFFDDDLRREHTAAQWTRVKQVSLNFATYSKWKGVGVMPEDDSLTLVQVITAVHRTGKRIRFWGAPDNEAGWRKLREFGADILNTDQVAALTAYLAAQRR